MKTALFELHKALYVRLANDTSLNETITGVYDKVSSTAVFPYVTISEPQLTPFTSKSSYGENITMVLHTWSDYNGKAESYNIINLILQALSSSPLQIGGGFSLFKMETEQMQVITDIDGTTYHGIVRLRFYINN